MLYSIPHFLPDNIKQTSCMVMFVNNTYIKPWLFLTSASWESFPSKIWVFDNNEFQCLRGARHCIWKGFCWVFTYYFKKAFGNKDQRIWFYQSLDAAAMADVTRLSEGKHPPGNIYSLIKSELRRYSSYLSSGIDMNYVKTNHFNNVKICQFTLWKVANFIDSWSTPLIA